tara:strand:- start:1751 stop:1945 length:195 start_codon:yes stop_codon:yes gene_type:complete
MATTAPKSKKGDPVDAMIKEIINTPTGQRVEGFDNGVINRFISDNHPHGHIRLQAKIAKVVNGT